MPPAVNAGNDYLGGKLTVVKATGQAAGKANGPVPHSLIGRGGASCGGASIGGRGRVRFGFHCVISRIIPAKTPGKQQQQQNTQ
jgi:hypothetical protein